MRIVNKQASFEYDILDAIEAGIVLTGAEVKSLREGHGSLTGSHVRIVGSEAFLINAQISPYRFARSEEYDPKRSRKLLLHKKELISLASKMDRQGLTLIPVVWYTIGRRVKLEIGLARGKKRHQKREKIKQEDIKRDLEREFRGKIK